MTDIGNSRLKALSKIRESVEDLEDINKEYEMINSPIIVDILKESMNLEDCLKTVINFY